MFGLSMDPNEARYFKHNWVSEQFFLKGFCVCLSFFFVILNKCPLRKTYNCKNRLCEVCLPRGSQEIWWRKSCSSNIFIWSLTIVFVPNDATGVWTAALAFFQWLWKKKKTRQLSQGCGVSHIFFFPHSRKYNTNKHSYTSGSYHCKFSWEKQSSIFSYNLMKELSQSIAHICNISLDISKYEMDVGVCTGLSFILHLPSKAILVYFLYEWNILRVPRKK